MSFASEYLILLTIRLGDLQLDAVIAVDVPCAIFARGPLTGEASTAERLDVEFAVESGYRILRRYVEIRLNLLSALSPQPGLSRITHFRLSAAHAVI